MSVSAVKATTESRTASCPRSPGRAAGWGLLAAALFAATATAQTANVTLHGAGGFAAGQTDGPNAYASGTPEGAVELHDFTLSVLATPSERLLVGAQVYWGVRNIFTAAEDEVNLVQAFAQYTLSDAAKLRAGVLRHPFGLYSETLEIGTLRPFLNLPRGVYSPGVFQWDGYRGLGVTGALAGDSAWSVEYDVYGGDLEGKSSGANPVFRQFGSGTEGQTLQDMVGGRLRLRTPVEGLVIGVSSYTGSPKEGLLGLPAERQQAYLGSVELLRNRWSLRSEYGYRDAGSGAEGEAAYLEAAFRPVPRWEVAARWDWFDATLGPLLPLPAPLATILEHEDLGVGVNFRVVDGLVLMGSYHQVEGNFFAAPVDGVDFLRGETLDTETRLLQLGAQFSF
jgi:hypothetical protein